MPFLWMKQSEGETERVDLAKQELLFTSFQDSQIDSVTKGLLQTHAQPSRLPVH